VDTQKAGRILHCREQHYHLGAYPYSTPCIAAGPTVPRFEVSKCLRVKSKWLKFSERRTTLDAVSESPSTLSLSFTYQSQKDVHSQNQAD